MSFLRRRDSFSRSRLTSFTSTSVSLESCMGILIVCFFLIISPASVTGFDVAQHQIQISNVRRAHAALNLILLIALLVWGDLDHQW